MEKLVYLKNTAASGQRADNVSHLPGGGEIRYYPVRPRKRIKCEHGREPDKCKEECGGSSFCQHGRQRSRCQKCGGSGLCKHGRERAKCKSAEEVDSISTGGQTATNARSAFRKSVLDVLCLTIRILVCKEKWLSSVRKNIRSNTQMVRSRQ